MVEQTKTTKNISIIIVSLIASFNAYAGEKLDEILSVTTNVTYVSKKYPHIVQTPDQTLKKNSGNCQDTALLVKKLAEEKGLKSEYQLEQGGRHIVVIVTDGIKKTRISNGKARR